MATWRKLTDYLSGSGEQVMLSWSEFDRIAGGLPPSATKYRAWWSGDRPHVRAWRAAGYKLASLDLGRSVTFIREVVSLSDSEASTPLGITNPEEVYENPPLAPGAPDIVLVACVERKREIPSAAKDLYISVLFRFERAYAEKAGSPWFILSAEHGLVGPDEWLAPYSRYLPETPGRYRDAWGEWVAARLELLHGDLSGKVIEVHAGAAYVETVAPPLKSRGAVVLDPLRGLRFGERLRWYKEKAAHHSTGQPELTVVLLAAALLEHSGARSPSQFLATHGVGLQTPGLYSWWVDDAGAKQLTEGLKHSIEPGLIYAGLAGATKWPSGKTSTNTLWSRIASMHLGANRELSTLRKTLAAILVELDEARLTAWMHDHLKVVACPCADADTLGKLEQETLAQIDPPLNLRGMADSPQRGRLTQLRKILDHGPQPATGT